MNNEIVKPDAETLSEFNLYEDTHGDGCGCPADQARVGLVEGTQGGTE